MPNIYQNKRIVAYENGRDDTIDQLKRASDKYIEVLIPFSDPIAESPKLQNASVSAMSHPHTTDDIFDLISDVSDSINAKIILSIYLNTAFAYGYDEFCKKAKESGVYALNVKDMPFKERNEMLPFLTANDIVLLNTLATADRDSLKQVLENSTDVVYISPALYSKLSKDALEELTRNIADEYYLDLLIDE